MKDLELIKERLEEIEIELDDMMNIRNLQEHEGDESYHQVIDELREERKRLKELTVVCVKLS